MSEARIIEVKEDDNGQRLDRWLKKVAPDLSYVLVQKLVRKGQIRIDGKRSKTDARLSVGQSVRLPSQKPDAHLPPKERPLSEADKAFIKSLVIYEDADVIALNKPHGLAVQGGSKTKRHIDGFLPALADKKGVVPRLVHRLDKDTSGLLLLARSAKAARVLGDTFKSRQIKKIYWALVTPTPEIHEGTIKAPLAKSSGMDRDKMIVDEQEGKWAATDYAVLDHAADRVAFMAFWPRTGRTHQIRAHAALMETPIVGDRKYGGAEAFIEGSTHPKQLHLHARRLVLPHPGRKGWLELQALLPPELSKSWKEFGFDSKNKDDPFPDVEL